MILKGNSGGMACSRPVELARWALKGPGLTETRSCSLQAVNRDFRGGNRRTGRASNKGKDSNKD